LPQSICFLKMSPRFLSSPDRLQGRSQPVVCGCIARGQGYRGTVVLDRLLLKTFSHQEVGQVEMSLRIVRVGRERLFQSEGSRRSNPGNS